MVIWLDNQKGKAFWVCSITRAEILAGLAMMPDGKRKQGLMDAAAAMFDEDFSNRCLPFDSDAANHYASIVSE